MGHVKKIVVDGQAILEIDYSDCHETAMKALVTEAVEIAQTENRPLLVLSCFNEKNYITPSFIRHVEKTVTPVVHLIDKQAILGLSFTQKFILKGLNIFLQRNFNAFDTRDEAIRYLLDKNIRETDLPDHFKKK